MALRAPRSRLEDLEEPLRTLWTSAGDKSTSARKTGAALSEALEAGHVPVGWAATVSSLRTRRETEREGQEGCKKREELRAREALCLEEEQLPHQSQVQLHRQRHQVLLRLLLVRQQSQLAMSLVAK